MDTQTESSSSGLAQQNPRSHLCGFYRNEGERLEMLAVYYKVGLDRGELCIFVTDQKPNSLITNLLRYGLDVAEAVANKKFIILPIKPTYLPDYSFKSMRMLDNLQNFVNEAAAEKYPGVRGGGDMDWVADKPAGWQQVVDYEAKINQFIRTNNFTGLCLFRDKLFDAEFVQRVIQTHQLVICGGNLHTNPYYIPPKNPFKFEPNLVSEIEKWLDKLDEIEPITATA